MTCSASPARGCWYVDNSLPSNGDGTTWQTAWNKFAGIGWNNVRGGDTIYISGGVDGQRYDEVLNINASGSLGAPITITGATGVTHGGAVTIDAQGIRSECIVVGAHNYIVIQRLTIQNTADDANLTVKGASAGVVIQDITSLSGVGPGGGGDCRCFDIRDCVAADAGSYAVILQQCTGLTPDSTTSQTELSKA